FVLVVDLTGLALFDDRGAAAQALEVGEPDAHTEVYGVAALEGQRVVGVGVGGEPVLAVYLLAVGLEGGEALLELGHALAARLDDLVVAVVNPYAPLKISALLLLALERFEPLRVGEDFRRHVEDVRVQLVQLLLADIGEGVVAQLRGVEREGLHAAEVFDVLRRNLNLGDGRDGEEEN